MHKWSLEERTRALEGSAERQTRMMAATTCRRLCNSLTRDFAIGRSSIEGLRCTAAVRTQHEQVAWTSAIAHPRINMAELVPRTAIMMATAVTRAVVRTEFLAASVA